MASDRIVTTRMVLQVQQELSREGMNKVLLLLETTEPDLAEYLLETSATLYHDLLRAGLSAKQARRVHHSAVTMSVVCINALRLAQADLWAGLIEPPTA